MKDKYFECGEEAIVGWGAPPDVTYLCPDHFQDALKETKAKTDKGKNE